MFEFVFTLDDNDYFEFNKHQLYQSPMNKKKMKFYPFIWPLIFMLFAFFFAQMTHSRTYYYFYGAASIAWIVFFKPMNNHAMKKKMQNMKKAGKLAYTQQEVTLRFSDDHILEKTASSESKADYTLVERVLVGDCAVYVYKSAISAYIVPNRVFQNEDEKAQFIAFVESKITNAC